MPFQLTVLTGPFIYWRLDNSVSEARFLTPEDRHKGVERLRANNTGTAATNTYKWYQVKEALLEIQTYVFFGMTLLLKLVLRSTCHHLLTLILSSALGHPLPPSSDLLSCRALATINIGHLSSTCHLERSKFSSFGRLRTALTTSGTSPSRFACSLSLLSPDLQCYGVSTSGLACP